MYPLSDIVSRDQLASLRMFGQHLRTERLKAVRRETFAKEQFIVYPSFNPNFTTK